MKKFIFVLFLFSLISSCAKEDKMAQENHNTEVDPAYRKDAENFWHNFMSFGKIATLSIIVVLLLMAVFLL